MDKQSYSTGLPEILPVRNEKAVNVSTKLIAETTSKRHTDVIRDTKRMILGLYSEADENFEEFISHDANLRHPGFRIVLDQRSYVAEIILDREHAMTLATGYDVKLRKRLIDKLAELENDKIAVPNFSDPSAAARAWAEQYEARQIAEQTKAEIGHRREATAMNTASQAVKKANKLEVEMDRSQQYATVKRMEKLWHGQTFGWRELKHTAAEIGIPPIDVFDANYGTVKAYHADVWQEAYALDIPHANDTIRTRSEEN